MKHAPSGPSEAEPAGLEEGGLEVELGGLEKPGGVEEGEGIEGSDEAVALEEGGVEATVDGGVEESQGREGEGANDGVGEGGVRTAVLVVLPLSMVRDSPI